VDPEKVRKEAEAKTAEMKAAAEEAAEKAAAEAAEAEKDLEMPEDEKLVPADEDPGEQPTEGPEWTEENGDKAMAAKQAAADAMGSGDYATAVEQYGVSLALQPSPLTFAKRAECYLKLKKPMAAIRDCDAALVINPDSAKGAKVRGMARRVLGEYEAAVADLGTGQKIDCPRPPGAVKRP
jgi:suppressor of tumorigenicity protein 13